MREIKTYETIDGKIFNKKEDAELYEKALNRRKENITNLTNNGEIAFITNSAVYICKSNSDQVIIEDPLESQLTLQDNDKEEKTLATIKNTVINITNDDPEIINNILQTRIVTTSENLERLLETYIHDNPKTYKDDLQKCLLIITPNQAFITRFDAAQILENMKLLSIKTFRRH